MPDMHIFTKFSMKPIHGSEKMGFTDRWTEGHWINGRRHQKGSHFLCCAATQSSAKYHNFTDEKMHATIDIEILKY